MPEYKRIAEQSNQKRILFPYLQISMAAWLENYGFSRVPPLVQGAGRGERDQALIFFNYIIKANGRVHLYAIEETNFDFNDIEEHAFISRCRL